VRRFPAPPPQPPSPQHPPLPPRPTESKKRSVVDAADYRGGQSEREFYVNPSLAAARSLFLETLLMRALILD
jgi:hypothetical protein